MTRHTSQYLRPVYLCCYFMHASRPKSAVVVETCSNTCTDARSIMFLRSCLMNLIRNTFFYFSATKQVMTRHGLFVLLLSFALLHWQHTHTHHTQMQMWPLVGSSGPTLNDFNWSHECFWSARGISHTISIRLFVCVAAFCMCSRFLCFFLFIWSFKLQATVWKKYMGQMERTLSSAHNTTAIYI